MKEKLLKLARWHPPIARGGMTWGQLRDLAHRIAEKRGLRAKVTLTNWPFRGSVQRVEDVLAIHVDQVQAPRWTGPDPMPKHVVLHQRKNDQVYALAHEVGHVAMGHYELSDEGIWFHVDGAGDCELEAEADAFAHLVTRSPGVPVDWLLSDQLDLGGRRRL